MSINGLVYRDEVIRVIDLFTTSTTIAGYSFTNCLIVGPAVIIMTNSILANSVMNGDLEGMIWRLPEAQVVFGAVLFDSTTFRNCRFERVGFAGNDQFLEQFRLGLTGAA